jgi:hypothetical protein
MKDTTANDPDIFQITSADVGIHQCTAGKVYRLIALQVDLSDLMSARSKIDDTGIPRFGRIVFRRIGKNGEMRQTVDFQVELLRTRNGKGDFPPAYFSSNTSALWPNDIR